jgi:hypothetical protein
LFHQCLISQQHINKFAGKSNHHPGNVTFRAIIAGQHAEYLQSNRSAKTLMTIELLKRFRAVGVRFLRQEPGGIGLWLDVGDQLARTKISQALRDTNTIATPSQSNDGQASRNDDNGKKRKEPAPPSPDRNPKRVVAHDTIIREHDRATPTTATAVPTLLREVSPFPSVDGGADACVPSLEAIGASLQQDDRHGPSLRTNSVVVGSTSSQYYVSPMDASLFEILLEHEDSSIAATSSQFRCWSSSTSARLHNNHNPFVLPDLPSNDAPLRLSSISIKVWDDDVDGGSDEHHHDGSAIVEDHVQSKPREVSPISFAVNNTSLHNCDCGGGGRARSMTAAHGTSVIDEDFDDHLLALTQSDPNDHSTMRFSQRPELTCTTEDLMSMYLDEDDAPDYAPTLGRATDSAFRTYHSAVLANGR